MTTPAEEELQVLRTAPFGVGETAEARNEKILALAQVAYADWPDPANRPSPTGEHEPSGQEEPAAVPAQPAEALPLPLPPPPEGREWNRTALQAAREVGQELGVSETEMTEIVAYCASRDQAEPPDPDATLVRLREEWGSGFELNLLAAKLAARRLSPMLFEGLNSSGLGDDAKLIKFFAARGQEMAKAHFRVEAIRQDPGHAFNSAPPGSPAWQAAVEEVERLSKVAHGTRRVS